MSVRRSVTLLKTNYFQPEGKVYFQDSNNIKFVYVFKTKFLRSQFRITIKFILKNKLFYL